MLKTFDSGLPFLVQEAAFLVACDEVVSFFDSGNLKIEVLKTLFGPWPVWPVRVARKSSLSRSRALLTGLVGPRAPVGGPVFRAAESQVAGASDCSFFNGLPMRAARKSSRLTTPEEDTESFFGLGGVK